MESLADLLEQLGFMKAEVDFEVIHRELLPKYQEYLEDRMSVSIKWRALFDLQQGVTDEMNSQSLLDGPRPDIPKPKDDEAFRLFLESDINF